MGPGTTASEVGWVTRFVEGGSVIVVALASCPLLGTLE